MRIDVSSANSSAKSHFQVRTSVRNPVFRCPPFRCPPLVRNRKGTPKNFCDKDFAEPSGELSGAIDLKTLLSLGSALEFFRKFLGPFVSFLGFGVLFWRSILVGPWYGGVQNVWGEENAPENALPRKLLDPSQRASGLLCRGFCMQEKQSTDTWAGWKTKTYRTRGVQKPFCWEGLGRN